MKFYKLITSLFLAFIIVLNVVQVVSFASTNAVLSAENKTVKSGEQFTFEVSLDNVSEIYGGNFTLEYDSTMFIVDSYEFGAMVGNYTKNCNTDYQSAGNKIRVTFSGASALSENGVLITFTFTSKQNVSGSATMLFSSYKMYDENGNAVNTVAEDSVITITTENSENVVISVENKSVQIDNSANVAVKIENAGSVYGGNFTLRYDDSLLGAKSYQFGDILSEHTKNCNLAYQSAGNLIRVTFNGADSISDNGELISVLFDTKSQGIAVIEIIDCKMYDENGNIVGSSIVSGEISVEQDDTSVDIPSTDKYPDIINSFLSEHYYMDIKMDKSSVFLAVNGDAQEFKQIINGCNFSMLKMNNKLYIKVSSENRKYYVELSKADMDLLGMDQDDFEKMFPLNENVNMEFKGYSQKEYDNMLCDVYSFGNIDFYFNRGNIILIRTVDGEDEETLIINELSSAIPEDMLSVKGFSKTGLMGLLSKFPELGDSPVEKPDVDNPNVDEPVEQAVYKINIPENITVGDTFEIVISADNIYGFEAGTISIKYDSNILKYNSSEELLGADSCRGGISNNNYDEIVWAFVYTDSCKKQNSDLIKIKFTAINDGICPITVSARDWSPYEKPSILSVEMNIKKEEHNHIFGEWEIVTPAQVGAEGKEQQKCTICGAILSERIIPALPDVPGYVLGDANGDGKVTAADARIVLRTSAKLETLEGNLFLAADVNKDGKITAADARKILRVSAKIDTF